MSTTTPLNRISDLPSDGCIAITPWDGTRRRGFHIERIEIVFDAETGFATASPMSLTTGEITGEPRRVHLRFGLDRIEAVA